MGAIPILQQRAVAWPKGKSMTLSYNYGCPTIINVLLTSLLLVLITSLNRPIFMTSNMVFSFTPSDGG
jgi:hypothetical protein